MFKKVLSVLVAAFLFAADGPAMAQSSSLAASLSRLASSVQLEQDSTVEQDTTVIRRRSSGTMAAIGGVLTAAGLVLALRPPGCKLVYNGKDPDPAIYKDNDPNARGGFGLLERERRFKAVSINRKCDLRIWANDKYTDYTTAAYDTDTSFIAYGRDSGEVGVHYSLRDRKSEANRTLNYVGWTAVGTGAAMLWLGLRQVDVPFRVDLTVDGGFRATRSFGW